MPALADKRRDDAAKRPHLIQIGHYGDLLAPALLAGALTVWTATAWTPTAAAVTRPLAAGIATAGILALAAQLLIHQRTLCAACLDRVPLSAPQAAVDRYQRRLRLTHRDGLRALIGSAAPVVIAADLAQPSQAWPVRIAATLPAMAAILGYTYTFLALQTHRRLAPWCPDCR